MTKTSLKAVVATTSQAVRTGPVADRRASEGTLKPVSSAQNQAKK
jgi:hypothetical protein